MNNLLREDKKFFPTHGNHRMLIVFCLSAIKEAINFPTHEVFSEFDPLEMNLLWNHIKEIPHKEIAGDSKQSQGHVTQKLGELLKNLS